MPNYTSKTAAQGSVLFWLSQEVWRIRARERLIRVPVRLTRSTALVREPRSYWGSRRCRLAAENVGQGRIGGADATGVERSPFCKPLFYRDFYSELERAMPRWHIVLSERMPSARQLIAVRPYA